jgi:hypothetical protein
MRAMRQASELLYNAGIMVHLVNPNSLLCGRLRTREKAPVPLREQAKAPSCTQSARSDAEVAALSTA